MKAFLFAKLLQPLGEMLVKPYGRIGSLYIL